MIRQGQPGGSGGKDARDEAEWGVAPQGYRLPAATRLGIVRLQVADLDRSLAYYGQVLGMSAIENAGGSALLAAGDGGDVLVELRELRGATRVPRRGRLGLYHFAILLPDRSSLARFVAHLQQLGIAAGAADHLVSEAIYLHDPDGLGIEVYADRPRSAWEHRERELLMDTQPLDTDSLLRATPDRQWTGVPTGTTVGHIHLHVGDIAQASRFYHDALGLDRVVWSYPGALFLSAGGYHHHVGVNTWAAGAPAPADDDARLLEWELVVPLPSDAEAALDSLEAAGVEVGRGADGGVARDPWGTAVHVRPE
jgi:catechol 2,3-dioxygenase